MTPQFSLCLICFEDWCVPDGNACLACTISRQQRRGIVTTNVRAFDRGTWWGPTLGDIDSGDLADGFTVDEI